MRTALPILIFAAALCLARSDTRAAFNCFETPEGEHRCACTGADNCSEMQKSNSCKSDPTCDHSELGVLICSCKAVWTSRTGH
jgi:hypothetical protein